VRSILIGIAAAALVAAPAFAQYGGGPQYPQQDLGQPGGKDQVQGPGSTGGKDQDADRDVDRDDDADAPDQAGPPPPPPPGDEVRGDTWRGEDGEMHCRRSDGTTGLVIGGGAGALVGHGIDRHGERATGTIIGAIAGALVGRAIEQSARCGPPPPPPREPR
jgi:hypothetical protein